LASVDITGLLPGVYTGAITYMDDNGKKNRVVIPVRLTIKPLPPPPPLTGTWSGSWTESGPFGDEIDSGLTWKLTQSGSRVSGSYTQYITYSDFGNGGETVTGTLLRGVLNGRTLTISTDGGSVFSAQVSADGQSMSGSGGDDLFGGPFSLQKQ
jgi:hypothetical protein